MGSISVFDFSNLGFDLSNIGLEPAIIQFVFHPPLPPILVLVTGCFKPDQYTSNMIAYVLICDAVKRCKRN